MGRSKFFLIQSHKKIHNFNFFNGEVVKKFYYFSFFYNYFYKVINFSQFQSYD